MSDTSVATSLSALEARNLVLEVLDLLVDGVQLVRDLVLETLPREGRLIEVEGPRTTSTLKAVDAPETRDRAMVLLSAVRAAKRDLDLVAKRHSDSPTPVGDTTSVEDGGAARLREVCGPANVDLSMPVRR